MGKLLRERYYRPAVSFILDGNRDRPPSERRVGGRACGRVGPRPPAKADTRTRWHQTVLEANRVKNEISWFGELDATGLPRGGSRFQLHGAIPPRNLDTRFARGGFAAAGETGIKE